MDSSPQDTSYESLAARIQSREADAEEEFVAIFQRRVRGFAIAHTRDPDLADELAQEVLWAVIHAVREGKVQQPAQLPSFVLGTARNLLNDRLRVRSRDRTEPLTEEMEQSIPAVRQGDFERGHAARQAIGALEPHERWVLLLSLVDGLAAEEIALRLKIHPDAVRKRKSRALRKLAEILRPGSQSTGPRLLTDRDS
jgi:RNA polymerase sigma-70 factor (ECF subfamily)